MAAIEEHKPAEKRRALGRGLDSLLPSGPRVVSSGPATAVASAPVVIPQVMPPAGPAIVPQPAATTDSADAILRTGVSAPHGQEIVEIPLDLIDENPYQTRRTFDPTALNELAESIKASGLAQPIVVRPGAEGRFILVLGERRCRASKLAGNATVPAIVRKLGNEQAAEMTVVENLQRQDLNCLEQANAFARLSREFNLTQEQIGKRTGSSRESVANYMRLLKLPAGVLDLISQGKIGFSEARVLLEAAALVDEANVLKLAQEAAQLHLTVKELQGRVNFFKNFGQPEKPREPKEMDPNVKDAERRLRESLGMRVRVLHYEGNKGQIVIRYESLADFDRVLDLLGRDS
jgi:ParB family transcriptional regulator, chromosome partitioning protein